jgi:rhodanese-related sulfurtransferase
VAIPKITVEELVAVAARAAEADEQIALVDVREPHEWADGHVAYASHVALGTVPDHLNAFGADDAADPTYVICRSGGRSLHACEFAAAHSKHVVNVVGGMMAWSHAGHDVKVGN